MRYPETLRWRARSWVTTLAYRTSDRTDTHLVHITAPHLPPPLQPLRRVGLPQLLPFVPDRSIPFIAMGPAIPGPHGLPGPLVLEKAAGDSTPGGCKRLVSGRGRSVGPDRLVGHPYALASPIWATQQDRQTPPPQPTCIVKQGSCFVHTFALLRHHKESSILCGTSENFFEKTCAVGPPFLLHPFLPVKCAGL